MKFYNLRWNPKISSFKTQHFLDGFPLLNEDGNEGIGMDWSIREYEELEIGDWWILSRVGGDDNGIVGIGRFSWSRRELNPCAGENWRKRLHVYTVFEFFRPLPKPTVRPGSGLPILKISLVTGW